MRAFHIWSNKSTICRTHNHGQRKIVNITRICIYDCDFIINVIGAQTKLLRFHPLCMKGGSDCTTRLLLLLWHVHKATDDATAQRRARWQIRPKSKTSVTLCWLRRSAAAKKQCYTRVRAKCIK